MNSYEVGQKSQNSADLLYLVLSVMLTRYFRTSIVFALSVFFASIGRAGSNLQRIGPGSVQMTDWPGRDEVGPFSVLMRVQFSQ
jgi:hypothetical protein